MAKAKAAPRAGGVLMVGVVPEHVWTNDVALWPPTGIIELEVGVEIEVSEAQAAVLEAHGWATRVTVPLEGENPESKIAKPETPEKRK